MAFQQVSWKAIKAHIELIVWIDCGGISDKHETDSSTIIISDADSN